MCRSVVSLRIICICWCCYDIGEEEESELSNCIERGPLGIYRVQEDTPKP